MCAGGFEHPGDAGTFHGGVATLDAIEDADFANHGQVFTYRVEYPAKHFGSEARALFGRAAVFITPMIVQWREELAEQIAMAHVQFYGVETRVACQLGAAHKFICDLRQVSGAHTLAPPFAAEDANVVKAATGRKRSPRIQLIDKGKAAAVRELYRSGCAVAMHRVSHGLQMRHVVRIQRGLVDKRASIWRNGAVGDRGHAHTAGGDPFMELHQLLRRRATGGHALIGGCLDKAVAQRYRADDQ